MTDQNDHRPGEYYPEYGVDYERELAELAKAEARADLVLERELDRLDQEFDREKRGITRERQILVSQQRKNQEQRPKALQALLDAHREQTRQLLEAPIVTQELEQQLSRAQIAMLALAAWWDPEKKAEQEREQQRQREAVEKLAKEARQKEIEEARARMDREYRELKEQYDRTDNHIQQQIDACDRKLEMLNERRDEARHALELDQQERRPEVVKSQIERMRLEEVERQKIHRHFHRDKDDQGRYRDRGLER